MFTKGYLSWLHLFSRVVNVFFPSNWFIALFIIQILLTGLHIFFRLSTTWENLCKNQDNSSSVINCLILMTCVCYNALMWWGEISYWSLLGLKSQIFITGVYSRCLFFFHRRNLTPCLLPRGQISRRYVAFY